MLKLYFKQAWALLRQNPLFSVLYIVGTGLAIAMTTVVAVIYYTKLAPVYPEPYRDRTAVLHYLVCKSPDGKSMWTNAYSLRAVEEWAGHPKHARLTTATLNDMMAETCYIQPADRSGDFHPAVKLTDPAFFRVYPLEFLEGQPFTQADLDGGLHKAVITHDLATARFLCNRIVVMYLGKFVEITDPTSLVDEAVHPYTKLLISSAPDLFADTSNRIKVEGEAASAVAPPEGCRFYPRCPYTREICTKTTPDLVECAPGHFAACHQLSPDFAKSARAR